MAEIEAAANVGSFRGMNVHLGGSMGTQIPAYDGNKMSYLTGPLTVFFCKYSATYFHHNRLLQELR